VAELLRKTELNPSFIGLVSVNEANSGNNGFIGALSQIREIITIYNIDEVVFCAKDVPANRMIDLMSELGRAQIEYKIAPPESLSIIGSNSINTSGDLYMVEINSIARVNNRRNKRFFDFTVSLVLLVSFPFGMFIVKKPFGMLKNIFSVLLSRKSWVGYEQTEDAGELRLPSIRKGVLFPADALPQSRLSRDDRNRLNILYSRNYKIINDFSILTKGFSNLGRGG
jgi:O-antigen biosynthesis protein